MAIAFLVLVVVGLVGQMRLWPHALQGHTAPDFTLPKQTRGRWTLSDEDARVILLQFWEVGCKPCMVALPRLERIHQWAETQDKPVVVYCVHVGDPQEPITDLWAEQQLTMPVLSDLMGTVAETFRVNSYPQTFVIADGQVEQVHVGTRSLHVAKLQQQIESLLRTGNGKP